jgi:hypothetical protein
MCGSDYLLQENTMEAFLLPGINAENQRRSEDYTGTQRGQARFFTYYRFLVLRRHCSVGFRCVYASRFQEIQNRFIEKKL